MSILNEANMRIGDARGQLELERLRRDREERRAAMLAQGLQTLTQGGIGALQTGAQFATDYQAQKQAREQNEAMMAFKKQQAQDRAAREAAKMRMEAEKLGLTRADLASQAKLRDAKAAGEASLVQERRAEALSKIKPKVFQPGDIAKMHAGELEGLNLTGDAPASSADAASVVRSAFGKGEGPASDRMGRTMLDEKVDAIAKRYDERADATERMLVASNFTPEEAKAFVEQERLRPDRAALKAALLREMESQQSAKQKSRVEQATAMTESGAKDLALMESQAYGPASQILAEGREPTADDVEAFALARGITSEEDAATALAKAYDAAKKARAGYTKTEAETRATNARADKPATGRGLSVSEAEADEGLLNLRQMARDMAAKTRKMAPSMGPVASRVRDLDELVGGGTLQNMAKESGMTGVGGDDWAVYRSELDQFVQNYGKVLEGGKLTDADIIRYDRALKKTNNPAALVRILEEIQGKLDYIEQNRLIARSRAGRGSSVPSYAEIMGEEKVEPREQSTNPYAEFGFQYDE